MTTRLVVVIVTVTGLLILTGCEPPDRANAATPAAAASQPRSVSGTVLETMDAGGYTYVLLDIGEEKIWAAGPITAIKPGVPVSFSLQMPMKNFHSKALDRDFDTLYFVGQFVSAAPQPDSVVREPHAAIASNPAAAPIAGIKKAKGGKTVTEIIEQRRSLAGKSVKVRGQVVKFTAEVLNKNWIHVRDSSGSGDLTITTDGTAKLGDVITAQGVIALDRDFGYGYTYNVVMEDASITVE